MANVLDCDIVVEFEAQSFFYIHFRANALWGKVLASLTAAMDKILPLLFFYKDATKVDMPLSKGTKSKKPNPFAASGMTQGQFLRWFEFRVFLLLVWLLKNSVDPNYLLIAGRRTDVLMSFPSENADF